MNSKKTITLLVLATLLLALVPVLPVNAIAIPVLEIGGIAVTTGVYSNTVVVTGAIWDIAPGTSVELYWDSMTAWNGESGLLNTTTAESDGNYEVWFDVPEAVQGNHYVIVKSVADDSFRSSAAFVVTPEVDLSSSSGLVGDTIDVSVYGQKADKDVAIILVDLATAGALGANTIDALATPPMVAIAADDIGTGVGTVKVFEGTLANNPIQPGSLVLPNDGAGVWTDNKDGTLTNAGTLGTGTINYVTGAYDITYITAPGAVVNVAYDHFEAVAAGKSETLTTSADSDSLGSFVKRITIPVGFTGVNYLYTLDAKGYSSNAIFTIGAVITVTPDTGDVGDRIKVTGRGFDGTVPVGVITQTYPTNVPAAGIALTDGVTQWGAIIDDMPVAGVAIDTNGEFTLYFIVPETGDEDDFTLQVCDGTEYAEADFEVTALSEITVTPDYGPQGSTVSIEGINFANVKETDVTVELWNNVPAKVADIDVFETNSDGSFSGTFRIPTQVDATYSIRAYTDNPVGYAPDLWNIVADDTFRIGSVLVLLSDNEGPAGMDIVLTGNGFTAGEEWNATFGTETIFDDGGVSAGGLLQDALGAVPSFYVPQLPAGEYDITVLDIDTEIEIVVSFTVTEPTSIELAPATLPSTYNMSIIGYNWADDAAGTFDINLFNSTDRWDITTDVVQGIGAVTLTTTADGDFEAWWLAQQPNGNDLELGTYTLNITDSNDYFIQVEFTIGDEHISVAPRKTNFRIGDTVSFDIQHSFGNVAPVNGGQINVFDPSEAQYWEGDALGTWTKVGMYYTVAVSEQTAGLNPMFLLDDAPLGTWTYEWLDALGAEVLNGTFIVETSSADVVSGQVADLAADIVDLVDDISAVSDLVSDVTGEFDDVRSDIAAVADLAADAADAATRAAEAVTSVATVAGDAADAAADAAEAATAAKDAATGLTTLVYGAIGASLVAALAAIVSLMQISRRIAG